MSINSTSFTKTPQAGDNSYSYTQADLLASSLYDTATNVVTLDVMSNDLGGNAKTLFSIDDGNGNFLNDLLTNNVNTGWELLPTGNRIQIVNGKIQLDISHSLDGRGLESLAAGETITETFDYSIRLGNGTLSWAKVSFTVVGQNDATTGSATATLAAGSEDGAYILHARDLLTGFTDVDGDTLSVGGLTANHGTLHDNGDGTWTFTPTANYNGPVSLSYNVLDGNGGSVASSLSFNLTAVNDAPTGAATAVLAAGTENAAYTVSAADLLQGFSDVDIATNGQVLSVSGLSASNGTVVDNADGTYTITPSANYNGPVSLSYNVLDGNGGSVASSLSFNLTAVNDAPNHLALTITSAPLDSGLPGNTAFGQFSVPVAADPDGGVDYTYSMLSLNVTDLNGIVQTDTTPDLAVSSSGALSTGTGSNALQSGRIYEADIQVAQGSATYHETFTIITGTNQNDTVSGVATNGDDVIYGLQSAVGNGFDVILAGTGNDTVFGQAGKDEIHGGAGNDVLNGGGGNDTFVFDTALNATTNVDLIADFASRSDKIGLSNANGLFDQIATGPLGLGAFDIIGDATAATGATRIAYDPSTGALYYDADGSGTGAAIQFATLGSASHPTISASDFLTGWHLIQ